MSMTSFRASKERVEALAGPIVAQLDTGARWCMLDAEDFRSLGSYIRPDLDRIAAGGVALELHHGRGETDDHTWIWWPERRILWTGDLFIWVTPNAGNPQKVQRYAADWSSALREMAARRQGEGGPPPYDPRYLLRRLQRISREGRPR